MSGFVLPDAPSHATGPVKAWSQPVVIPTYRPAAPDKNPMFLEKRVYQGSSGKVYPLPFIDRIAEDRIDQSWDAVHIENQYIRVMVLPQLGGRIHVGLDKINGYDFFYRQNVIKPALVGLAGPWISGGVEFNWPQHHRPATFMPVDWHIEEHADGSRTVWMSDHEPMNRMKGMHGVCLHPNKAFVELKVRLFNRTEFVQTFLWWANVATRVHERYQSFFPPDVSYVADHAKRATSTFPLCDGHYYGVDYKTRSRRGVPPDQAPAAFVPPGSYAANDLGWYANIPVPTSYMAMGSKQDFFGGYDHARQAGVVHVANHHISPGKKQWTWGNHEFGYTWDRNLTDADGPYIELMAGVYTDNQPDFSFLHPGETRTFSQFWYPIRDIGPAHAANLDAALSVQIHDGAARIGLAVSKPQPDLTVVLQSRGKTLHTFTRDVDPTSSLVDSFPLPKATKPHDLAVVIRAANGSVLLEYRAAKPSTAKAPDPATEPPAPEAIESNDELYITGLHLQQYRHATRQPEIYWREALRRDPTDSRCNNALGLWHLRRGEFAAAERHFQTAVATLTQRNPNPYDGEPLYNLGLTLRYLGRHEDAYAAFYKATWNYAWQSAAFHALAELDCRVAHWSTALDHLDRALRVNADNTKTRNLKAIVLRNLNQADAADALLRQTLALDPLDHWARYLLDRRMPADTHVHLDIALDFARAGLWTQAIELLQSAPAPHTAGTSPLLHYYMGYFHEQRSNTTAARKAYRAAAKSSPDYCFPARLDEILILQSAIAANPSDALAPYYLANLFYDRRRHEEAITLWEKSARRNPRFSIVWRNLGIAYFNIRHDPRKACAAYDKALRTNPHDARLLYERDQLWKRIGRKPQARLVELLKYPALVKRRDDLAIELATLYNQTAQHDKALAVIQSRKFQPWEGGEGMALGQHVRTRLALGRAALAAGNPASARTLFEAALQSPENLGEAKHLLANQSDIYYWLGVANEALADLPAAKTWWKKAAASRGDFQEMSVKSFSEMTYYNALALRKLGQTKEARQLLRNLLAYADQLMKSKAKIDYFATSLPAMLLFDDDLQKRNTIAALFLRAQAKAALGEVAAARQLLRQVLKADGNHPFAGDLLAELH
jgi:tetratricopeptide (TPR) repeat protein